MPLLDSTLELSSTYLYLLIACLFCLKKIQSLGFNAMVLLLEMIGMQMDSSEFQITCSNDHMNHLWIWSFE